MVHGLVFEQACGEEVQRRVRAGLDGGLFSDVILVSWAWRVCAILWYFTLTSAERVLSLSLLTISRSCLVMFSAREAFCCFGFTTVPEVATTERLLSGDFTTLAAAAAFEKAGPTVAGCFTSSRTLAVTAALALAVGIVGTWANTLVPLVCFCSASKAGLGCNTHLLVTATCGPGCIGEGWRNICDCGFLGGLSIAAGGAGVAALAESTWAAFALAPAGAVATSGGLLVSAEGTSAPTRNFHLHSSTHWMKLCACA
mmetsp:Transcript_8727/g.15749  ORF Transcript_8727/g.15749 Transcript_8727/m.15749 type:complete len:256 (+) Transcript_8727:64-831(+)